MANIRIVIDEPDKGTRNAIDVPDNMQGYQLLPALISTFNLPLLSGNTVNRYKLVRVKNEYVFKDVDTIRGIRSAPGEMFAIVIESQVQDYIRELQDSYLLRIPSPLKILFGLLAGIFYIVFSFPKGVTNLGISLGWSLVQNGGTAAKSVLGGLFGATISAQTASFNNLWMGVILAVLVYLVGLAALSLRHGRIDLFGLGLLCLFIGTACLQLFAWLVYLILWLLNIVLIILVWIFHIIGLFFSFLGRMFSPIFGFLGRSLGNFFGFLVGSGWWILALSLVVVGIFLAVKYRSRLLKAILWILAAGGIGYLLIKLFQFLSPYIRQILGAIGQFLAPIFAFIGRILGVIFHYLFIGFFVGFVVYGLGALLIDQFRGAWNAGNGKRGVTLGALSIGTSLALVLLQSNLGDVARFYPADLPHFVLDHLYQANPIFDIVITLLILGVSVVGILRNFPQLQRGPSLQSFQTTMVLAVPVLVLSVALVAVSHQTES